MFSDVAYVVMRFLVWVFVCVLINTHMSQYKTGTVDVTNGSSVVTGTGTKWSSSVSAGDVFVVVGDSVSYTVASVASDTQLTLSAPYRCTSSNCSGSPLAQTNASYSSTSDSTTYLGAPKLASGDVNTATLVSKAFDIFDTAFENLDLDYIAFADVGNGLTVAGSPQTIEIDTTVVPRLSASNTFTATGGTATGAAINIDAIFPGIHLDANTQATDEKNWLIAVNATNFEIGARNDADTTLNAALTIGRSTDTPNAATFSTTLGWGSGSAISSSDNVKLLDTDQTLTAAMRTNSAIYLKTGSNVEVAYLYGATSSRVDLYGYAGVGLRLTGNALTAIDITSTGTIDLYQNTTLLNGKYFNFYDSSATYYGQIHHDGTQVLIASSHGPVKLNAAATITGDLSMSASNVVLDNGQSVTGKESGGTQRSMVEMNSSNQVSVGSGNNETKFWTSGAYYFQGGTVSTSNASASEVGYKGVPLNLQGASFTLSLGYCSECVFFNASGMTVTIPQSSSVAWPTGTRIKCVTGGYSGVVAPGSGVTLRLDTSGGNANRTIAAYSVAELYYVGGNVWIISGNGVS